MKWHGVTLLMVALTCIILKVEARADDREALKEINALYNSRAKLYNMRDFEGIAKMMTPDCKLQEKNGKSFTPQAWVKEMQRQLSSVTGFSLAFRLNSTAVKGKTASIKVNTLFSGVQKNKKRYSGNTVSQETLVKAADGWKIKSSRVVTQVYLQEGKPFTPGAETGK